MQGPIVESSRLRKQCAQSLCQTKLACLLPPVFAPPSTSSSRSIKLEPCARAATDGRHVAVVHSTRLSVYKALQQAEAVLVIAGQPDPPLVEKAALGGVQGSTCFSPHVQRSPSPAPFLAVCLDDELAAVSHHVGRRSRRELCRSARLAMGSQLQPVWTELSPR